MCMCTEKKTEREERGKGRSNACLNLPSRDTLATTIKAPSKKKKVYYSVDDSCFFSQCLLLSRF